MCAVYHKKKQKIAGVSPLLQHFIVCFNDSVSGRRSLHRILLGSFYRSHLNRFGFYNRSRFFGLGRSLVRFTFHFFVRGILFGFLGQNRATARSCLRPLQACHF